jgi:hypothetical protein
MEILVNHLGYESSGPKKAVLKACLADPADTAAPNARAPAVSLAFRVLDAAGGVALKEQARFIGPVPRWKDWLFWILDFSGLHRQGRYVLELPASGLRSEPFEIADRLLLRRTVPAVLRYFRSQRCGGAWDEADRHVGFYGGRPDRVDVHGGWHDASGDLSKYLSHLSHANYLNPQHSPLAVWAFLAAARLLEENERSEEQMRRELLEEALYGAEFLQRMQDPAGYFYIGVFDRWTHEPGERAISTFRGQQGQRGDDYQAAYRQGGGLAIAALARASTVVAAGAGRDAFLQAAARGFTHLEAHNREYLDDRRENIIDDYCALLAAVELSAASGQRRHLRAARRRARSLAGRLGRDGSQTGYWRADRRGERPFFHAAEAGLPVIALLRYAEVEPERERAEAALRAARRSLGFELAITGEVANPFGYARQYVKPTDGPKRAAFFFPHRNESGYWWQGENARLASLAAAANLARRCLAWEPELDARLERYATDQLNWILGCNPFDVCMLHGFGRDNPEYEERYPNAFGGICNGITGGFTDEEDIDFLPSPYAERGEHRWRWSEQWIPHAAWYLLAVCSMPEKKRN